MIDIVNKSPNWTDDPPNRLFVDDANNTYYLSYTDETGVVNRWSMTKELAYVIKRTIEEFEEREKEMEENNKMKFPLPGPGKIFSTPLPTIVNTEQMVEKGYTAQDLINLKREGII